MYAKNHIFNMVEIMKISRREKTMVQKVLQIRIFYYADADPDPDPRG